MRRKNAYAIEEIEDFLNGKKQMGRIDSYLTEYETSELFHEGKYGEAIDNNLKLLCGWDHIDPDDRCCIVHNIGIAANNADALSYGDLGPSPIGKLWKELDSARNFPRMRKLIFSLLGLVLCLILAVVVWRLPYFDALEYTDKMNGLLMLPALAVSLVIGISFSNIWAAVCALVLQGALISYVVERYPMGIIAKVALSLLLAVMAAALLKVLFRNLASLELGKRRKVRRILADYQLLTELMHRSYLAARSYRESQIAELKRQYDRILRMEKPAQNAQDGASAQDDAPAQDGAAVQDAEMVRILTELKQYDNQLKKLRYFEELTAIFQNTLAKRR